MSINPPTELYKLVVSGQLDQVRALIDADSGAARRPDGWGFTPLHGAAGEDCVEIAELLLRSGARADAFTDEGITPLHLAAYPDMVELLVRFGADPNARSASGQTPLHVQVEDGAEAIEVIEALLRSGADGSARDAQGLRPADVAEMQGERDVADLLRA